MDIEFLSDSGKFNKRKLKFAYSNDIEPHEALLDSLAEKKEREIGFGGRKFEIPLSSRTLRLFLFLSVALVVFLFGKTFQMQVLQGKSYTAKAERNKFIVSQIEAERGVIYDKNMEQLVYNEPSFDLVANKSSLPEDENERNSAINEMSQIIGMSPDELKNKLEEEGSSVAVLSNIPHETLIILETKIDEFPGFEIKQDWVRQYKDGQYFSHVIGYTGKITSAELASSSEYSSLDWVGRAGLEKSYEEVLKKNAGSLQIERDALGKEISRTVSEEPQSGDSLVLYLDSGLQKEITDVLQATLERIGSKKASAVALDPNTGGVLAMVSLPNFDNNLFNKGADYQLLSDLLSSSSQPLYNLAVSGQFPSGSTIKPLIAAGILQDKIISASKSIYCEGQIEIPNPWNPDLPTIKKDWVAHGYTDIRKAIAESCDVFFYTTGGGFGDQKGLGAAGIEKYLKLFGWGQKTGIDLPSESWGLIPTPSWKKETKGTSWTDGDTYNITIGQGDILVTPLQMAMSFVAVANGGKLLQPQLVEKVIDSGKNTIEAKTTTIIRENFIDSINLEIVREGMRRAVTGENSPQASAVSLNSLPVAVAAKTGTAQTGKYKNGEELYDNWITVFAPYDNPQMVLTIMFQDVQGIQGATLPSAKEILNWYFTEGGGGASAKTSNPTQ
jgi:penicillin-binding protein 2